MSVKGVSWKTRSLDTASIYCEHNRFKDQCPHCPKKKPAKKKKK